MSVKIKKILYEFRLGDVEDPEIYAAGPLIEWEKSEVGQWCMTHCVETPEFAIMGDPELYGYRVVVTGVLTEKDLTYYTLKWQENDYTKRP